MISRSIRFFWKERNKGLWRNRRVIIKGVSTDAAERSSCTSVGVLLTGVHMEIICRSVPFWGTCFHFMPLLFYSAWFQRLIFTFYCFGFQFSIFNAQCYSHILVGILGKECCNLSTVHKYIKVLTCKLLESLLFMPLSPSEKALFTPLWLSDSCWLFYTLRFLHTKHITKHMKSL